jgi:hypothetical protein
MLPGRILMRRTLDALLIAAGLFVPACSAQEFLDEVNFKANQLSGIHLLGVSVYSGWSSSALPQSGFSVNSSPGIGNLGGDVNYGATASLGWQYHREKTDVSVLYGGSYGGMVRYSNLNAYSQSLSLALTRRLGPKWTFSVTASGNDSTVSQYLFQPSSLGVITQIPSSFDDLAAAFAAGQFSNAQAASMLTGAPVMQTAGRSLLLGDRVLSYTTQANIGYAVSSRLQLHFASFAAAGQTRLGGQEDVAPLNYVMPRSMGVNAGAGFSYSLSPRTEIGIDVEGNRTVNHFQSVYSNTASAFLGRKMGMHWFLNVHGGGTYGFVTQQAVGTPKTSQAIGGGALGFRTGLYTLVASYDRSASDSFGFAVGTITSMSGAWSWHHPGSRWSIFASYGQQQTRNTGFTSLCGWQMSSGLNTSLNEHTSLSLQYVYMDSSGTYLGTYNHLAVQSVRLSFGWAPQAVNR